MKKYLFTILLALFIGTSSFAYAFTVQKWSPENYLNSTLSGIAKQFDIVFNDLIIANPQIEEPNLIHEGDEINIPNFDTPILGSYNPSGGGTYRLKSSVSSSDTSITLSSFKEPVSSIAYTMSYLNSDIAYGTLDPQTSYSEFISFTGITQNADGSATLSGVSRGLGRSYPYTASSTLRQAHSGQSIFILSNAPQLYNEYVTKRNNDTISGSDTITGQWYFSYPPVSTETATSSSQLATRKFVQDTAIQGAATSTFVNLGISQLAKRSNIETGFGTTSEGRPLVISSSFATSTPTNPNFWKEGGYIPSTNSLGQISAQFVATSSAYNWTGTSTFQGAGGVVIKNASTTINGVNYIFPSSIAASSTALVTNSTGNVYWGVPSIDSGSYVQPDNTTGNLTINHNLGRIPYYFELNLSSVISQTVGGNSFCGTGTSHGYATSTVGTSQYSNWQSLNQRGDTFAASKGFSSTSPYVAYLENGNGGANGVDVAVQLTAMTSTSFTLNWVTNTNGAAGCTGDGNTPRSFTWKVY